MQGRFGRLTLIMGLVAGTAAFTGATVEGEYQGSEVAALDAGDPGEDPGKAAEQRAAFERELRAAREDLLARLMELAAWCQAEKLFATRLDVLREVLALEPDHPEARRELGYRREKDGTWREPRQTRAPRDHNPRAEADAEQRLQTAGEPYRDQVLLSLERYAAALSPARRKAALREVLGVLPDDELVRGLLGEVHDRGEWVLAETARGRRVRAELRPRVRRLLAQAEASLRPIEESERDQGYELPFLGAWRTAEVRVLVTTDAAEGRRTAAAVTAARHLVNTLLGTEAAYDPNATIYLLQDPAQGAHWLARNPDLTEEQRTFNAKLEGCSVLATRDLAYWADDVKRRVDGVVRLAISGLLWDSVGITPKQGMLSEGLGLYLTRELVGTRLTWFVQPSRYLEAQQDLRLRNMLLDPDVNWMNEAFLLFQAQEAPKLQFLLGKEVSRLTTEELLVSYVAAAYLLEGWPDELPVLLKRIGAGESPAEVIEEVLGHDVVELDARMHRWLGERR